MIRLTIEKPATRQSIEVEWAAVPRIGDSVHFGDDDGVTSLTGEVKAVCWWQDGSARVVLR